MTQHSFQVGDRVICDDDVPPKPVKGTLIKKNPDYNDSWLVLRDDKYNSSVYRPYYSYMECLMKHDTDLQVGDWVRYEAIGEDRDCFKDKDGEEGRVEAVYPLSADCTKPLGAGRYLRNLVKIQKPTCTPQEKEDPIESTLTKRVRDKEEQVLKLEEEIAEIYKMITGYKDLKRYVSL